MSVSRENRNVVRQPSPAPAPLSPPVAAPVPSHIALQQRAERMLVRAVPQVKYQLARVGPAGLAGVGTLLAAGVAALVLLLPAHQSVLALKTELTKAGHTLPGTVKPEQSPRQFAATLPSREQVPALLGVVLVQAEAAGIVLDQGRYTYSPATANRLARYTFEFPVKADYGNIRAFINKSLAAVPALGLDKLHVERKNVADTLVSADVGFVIYLRGA